MEIKFNSSPGPSLGIEVELEVVDKATGELASAATEILAEMARGHEGEHPKAKHELFECTIEIITGVCQTVAEARADLTATLAEVQAQCDKRGLALLCTGTHPFSSYKNQKISPNPRYAKLIEDMRWMAERLLIFGVHVHVGVKSPEKAVAFTNALAGYIPHLLALTSSSPFWEGDDTGLASCRSKVFEGLPTAGLPEPIESWEEFEKFMGTLVSSEAIGTVREVWWDIRPHPDFGTIEMRMCDGISSMDEIAAIAAMVQSLVAWLDSLHERGYKLPRHSDWVLSQNKWRAGRFGLDARIIIDEHGTTRPLIADIEETLDELLPIARKLGCADELEGVRTILARGNSSDRQRAVVADGGSMSDVVSSLVEELSESAARTEAPPPPRPTRVHDDNQPSGNRKLAEHWPGSRG